jgi:hypothetical protein
MIMRLPVRILKPRQRPNPKSQVLPPTSMICDNRFCRASPPVLLATSAVNYVRRIEMHDRATTQRHGPFPGSP